MRIKEYKLCNDLLYHWILYDPIVSVPISNLNRLISDSRKKKRP